VFFILCGAAGAFLPPTTVLGAGLYSISVYGGLAIFSGLMLYDTQKVMKKAELTPYYSNPPFDPINRCTFPIFCVHFYYIVIVFSEKLEV